MANVTDWLSFVTGTTSGLGRALAQELLRRGWEVIGMARRPSAINHEKYHHLQLDLGEIGSIQSSFQQVGNTLQLAKRQRVGLVNNAASPGQFGALEALEPSALLRLYAVNVVAPVWLMGFLIRTCRSSSALRIVNLSSGAAVRPFPGLGAYGSSKAALRMAGMVLGAELGSTTRPGERPSDLAILSYEPGLVDTDMQATARSRSPEEFPWVDQFRAFAEAGQLVAPEAVVVEIADFLEADRCPLFIERRFGVGPSGSG
ncbi:MAG TPA: SDR family NAD(P)-dependent oxidoreductase [Gammaproteobacteria bacterium]|nr:SDR family NAD(P)-dependent oxidoreductase [Gammaproteobacteria bacterium]